MYQYFLKSDVITMISCGFREKKYILENVESKQSPNSDETLENFYSPLVAPYHLRNDFLRRTNFTSHGPYELFLCFYKLAVTSLQH